MFVLRTNTKNHATPLKTMSNSIISIMHQNNLLVFFSDNKFKRHTTCGKPHQAPIQSMAVTRHTFLCYIKIVELKMWADANEENFGCIFLFLVISKKKEKKVGHLTNCQDKRQTSILRFRFCTVTLLDLRLPQM